MLMTPAELAQLRASYPETPAWVADTLTLTRALEVMALRRAAFPATDPQRGNTRRVDKRIVS